jgi:hypothetical protein
MLDDLFDDETHRELARSMLISSSKAFDIEVARVEFGPRSRELPYSWLCYLADPRSENLVAALTATSAVDHLKRFDPNGFLSATTKRIAAHVYALELSREASFILIGDEGEDVVISPWQQNLVVVRAKFTYELA